MSPVRNLVFLPQSFGISNGMSPVRNLVFLPQSFGISNGMSPVRNFNIRHNQIFLAGLNGGF